MALRFLFTAFSLLVVSIATAQPGVTKLDANAGSAPSYPLHITLFGNNIAYYANNGTKGWELHTTDGINTPMLVSDLNPLGGSAIGLYYQNPIAALGSKLYFTADNGFTGPELFSYNGSSTPLLTPEIEIGGAGSAPDNFVTLGGKLYFRARTATEGYELWQYDPNTNANTRLTDINPGADSAVTGNVIVFNNKIYFTADSGMGNNELWVYDPNTSTPAMVADIYPGTAPSNPQNVTIINSKLYFSADNGTNGRELYMYDGTSAPARVTDVVTGSQNGVPDMSKPLMGTFNNKIYFAGSNSSSENQVYVYDPATGNAAFATSTNGAKTSEPAWFTPYGGKLYFTAFNDTTGIELWAYDGNTAPSLVFEMCKGVKGSNPQQLLATGDDLYFRADDCNGIGEELFRYNYKKLSVRKLQFAGEASLFPNPAKDAATLQLTLQKAEDLLIDITDMQGRIVYTTGVKTYTATTHQVAIPLSQLATGSYHYNVYSEAGNRYISGKLVKQ